MSGGHFNYNNDDCCHEIYGWGVSADYGKRGFEQSKLARRINPFEDLVISELVFDVFCLIHSFDWYYSGDTCEENYRNDVKHFKDKWLSKMHTSRIKEIVDDEIDRMREELYQAFNLNEVNNVETKENRTN